jgi:hypothetical protein
MEIATENTNKRRKARPPPLLGQRLGWATISVVCQDAFFLKKKHYLIYEIIV